MISANLLVLASITIGFTNAIIYPSPHPDPAPAGYSEWISPIVVPAPNVNGDNGWAAAVSKAQAFVNQLTLQEKINMTTGVGTTGRCLGEFVHLREIRMLIFDRKYWHGT